MSAVASSRRPDLDALRVFACWLLLLFHVGMVFNPAPFYHVRNDATSFVFLVICGFIGLWHMPLLFFLAGWSAAASLRSRGILAFLGERVRKLFVPLVAGCVLLAPVIKWIELRGGQDLNHRGLFVSPAIRESIRSVLPIDLPLAAPFDESFFELLPTFFTHLDRFTWSHLWFIAYLLVFTVVLLPVLAPLARRRSSAAGRPSRLWIWAPLLPLSLVQLLLRERFPGPYNLYRDWANVSFFLVFLLCGFAMALVPALEERLHEERRRVLGLGLASTAVLLAAVLGAFQSPPVLLIASGAAGWCFVLALVSYARTRVTRGGPRLAWAAESAFPVYVLHQPVIVLIGALVVTLPLGVAPKFALLLASATAVTFALFQWAVRPFAAARFLLGMKPRRSLSTASEASSASERATPGRLARGTTPFALALVLLGAARAEAAAEPTGLWWAEGGFAQVEISRCADALCGRVVWLRHPLGAEGCALRDVENPEPALRSRSVAGLSILRELRETPGAPGEWSGGEIYDPSSGRTYRAVVELDGPDRLRVRGYIGVRLLGRTTTWVRVGTEDLCASGV